MLFTENITQDNTGCWCPREILNINISGNLLLQILNLQRCFDWVCNLLFNQTKTLSEEHQCSFRHIVKQDCTVPLQQVQYVNQWCILHFVTQQDMAHYSCSGLLQENMDNTSVNDQAFINCSPAADPSSLLHVLIMPQQSIPLT